jgi:peptidoglycan/LPS O-acetylase OafA/YrhL
MLRGIAALMVCMHHFTEHSALEPVGRYGLLGVYIFFVISGFVVPYAMHQEGYRLRYFHKFLLKRVIRIEPAYIASIFLTVLMLYLASLHSVNKGEVFTLEPPRLFSHFFYLTDFMGYTWYNAVYWTLAIEFQFYLLISVVFPLIDKRSPFPAILFFMAGTALGIIFPNFSLFFRHTPFFIAGLCLYFLRTGKWPAAAAYGLAGACLICTGLLRGWDYASAEMAALLFIQLVIGKAKPLMWLGTISYSLYLVHIPIGGHFVLLMEMYVYEEPLRSLILFPALAISIASAWLFYRVFEKPFMRLSKKVRYRE